MQPAGCGFKVQGNILGLLASLHELGDQDRVSDIIAGLLSLDHAEYHPVASRH